MWKVYASVALAAGIVAGAYFGVEAIWQRGWDARDLKAKADTAAAIEEALVLERQQVATERKAYENKIRSLQRREAEVLAGANIANGLLDASRASLRQAAGSLEACVVSATTHADILAQCQQEYRDVAKAADGHVADIKALTNKD
jgi:hypothetical protein